jgi:hypothetical protein
MSPEDPNLELLANASSYEALVAKALREEGWQEDDSEGAPRCRWVHPAGGTVDVMTAVDFELSGRWYPAAITAAKQVVLDEGLTIRVVTAPYFLAMKIEAFLDRGDDDWQASELIRETADDALTQFLSSTFREWTDTGSQLPMRLPARLGPPAPFVQHARGHFPGDAEGEAAASRALTRLRAIGDLVVE